MTHLFEGRIILDIIIITVIIFSIYRTLQATGTWKIALGLGLAVLLAVLARVLGLQGTEWIFSNFSPIALLMLLIIFQPEIRRILERSFFLGQLHQESENNELSVLIDKALFELSERNWGTIIVLPGKIPIQQWITDGIHLDGIASLHLLLSIFDAGSPGHDGAVVIDNERVDRFAVHLPLSQTNRLSKLYGTRHNAAMGLAEKTDALIFTVSEERGEVSAFHEGRHIILRQPGDAEKMMEDHFQQKQDPADLMEKKKKLFPALIGITTSFALAILLWTTLIQPRTELREMLFSVPIEYIKKDKNIVLKEKINETKLLLEGPIAALRSLEPSELRILVDVSNLEPGRHNINLGDETVIIPNRFKIIEMDPDSFDIDIKQLFSHNIPIKPQLIGSLPKGFILVKTELSPPAITATMMEETGAKETLTTTPIYLSGLRESTTVYCKLVNTEGLQLQDKKSNDVIVHLTIRKK